MMTNKTTTINDQAIQTETAMQIGSQAIKELNKLGKAVTKLYNAGEWKLSPKKMPVEDQAKLWETVRKALNLPKNNTVNAAISPATILVARRARTSVPAAMITGITP